MPRAVKPKVTIGSDNVFTDLGFTNADEMLAKSELVSQINRIIESRGLTQVEAAKLLRVHQPKVSALKHGRLSEFSIDTLMRFLVRLGKEVNIQVRSSENAALKVAHARW